MDQLRIQSSANTLLHRVPVTPREQAYVQLWRDAAAYLKTCRTEDVDRILDAVLEG